MNSFGCFSWITCTLARYWRKSRLDLLRTGSKRNKPITSPSITNYFVKTAERMSKDMKKYWVGKRFDIDAKKYKVVDVIDCGRTSAVLKAVCGKDIFAIKRAIAQNEEERDRLNFEIKIMQMFSACSKILDIHGYLISDCEMDTTEYFIIMPYYSAASYLNRMKTIVPEPERYSEAMAVFCDVCEALYYLHTHDQPIVHRDVKVENVLQDENKYILCDFGSCVYESDLKKMSRNDRKDSMERYTTPAYRSPEIVSGEDVTVKSDIWALGCMLYYMCFYTMPFGDQVMSIMNATFSLQDGNAPPEIKEIITCTLKGDPKDRPDIISLIGMAFNCIRRPVDFISNKSPQLSLHVHDNIDMNRNSSPNSDEIMGHPNFRSRMQDEFPGYLPSSQKCGSERDLSNRFQDQGVDSSFNSHVECHEHPSYEEIDILERNEHSNQTSSERRIHDHSMGPSPVHDMRINASPKSDTRFGRFRDQRNPQINSNVDIPGSYPSDLKRRMMNDSNSNVQSNINLLRAASTRGNPSEIQNHLSPMTNASQESRMKSVRMIKSVKSGADHTRDTMEECSDGSAHPFISYLYRNNINPFKDAPFDLRNRVRITRSGN